MLCLQVQTPYPSTLLQKLVLPKMCDIPQLVWAPLNPRSIVDHFRRSHPQCEHSYWQSSLRGRRSKGKGKGITVRDHARGRRGTPARKPLFSPSCLLIKKIKITQLWMTSCRISLAVMYCFSFVFLKQEIYSKGTIKFKCRRPSKESSLKVATMCADLHKSSINLFKLLLKESGWKTI